jgi:superfamily I DNA/RNA helicase
MAKKKIDLGYTPSIYQEKIFDFVQHGTGNAVISAYAGSGKTLTLVSCMKLIPKSQKCLFLAFNKSIVNELAERVKDRDNCQVKTMHSLGFLMLRRNLGSDIEVDEHKYETYIKKNIAELTSIEGVRLTTSQVNEYIDSIIALIDFCRYNLAQNEKEIERIATRYNIPVSFDEASVVKKALQWGKENWKTIDYTDMVWLPVELSLKPAGLQYDWVLNDECQDFSLAYIQLMFKCFKKGTRFISVGDEKQSINQFAGSSEEAFKFMCNYPNTQVFPLPITYRCPVSVVNAAKEYVSDIQARENAPIGEIKNDCHIKDIKEGDMVLARTKAPLLKLYARLLRKGIKCYIKGSDIGANLEKILEHIDKKNLGVNLVEDGVFVRLYDNLFTERNKLMKNYGLSKDDATLSIKIMEKYDSINSMLILSERIKTKTELIKKIREIFKEEGEGIMLSTIHKAKGLEADNVYILCRSSMPSRLAKSDWEKQQEENLIYVAITRPKRTLGFVSEKELPSGGASQEPTVILTELRMIEKQVCSILGKEPMPEDDNIEIDRIKAKNATVINEDSMQVAQNTVMMNENKSECNDNKEISDLIMSYIGNGGDLESLKRFLNK